MEIPFNLLKFFENVVIKAAAGVEIIDSSFDPQVRVADERFGDFQANGVLPFAKKNGLNPREIAQNLVENIMTTNLGKLALLGRIYKF